MSIKIGDNNKIKDSIIGENIEVTNKSKVKNKKKFWTILFSIIGALGSIATIIGLILTLI